MKPTQTQFTAYQKIFNKLMYRCPGCGTKVWGKGGLGLVCECGRVLLDSKGKSKDGLAEKVCRVLLEECGYGKLVKQADVEVCE